jgi:hypothetical protein
MQVSRSEYVLNAMQFATNVRGLIDEALRDDVEREAFRLRMNGMPIGDAAKAIREKFTATRMTIQKVRTIEERVFRHVTLRLLPPDQWQPKGGE